MKFRGIQNKKRGSGVETEGLWLTEETRACLAPKRFGTNHIL